MPRSRKNSDEVHLLMSGDSAPSATDHPPPGPPGDPSSASVSAATSKDFMLIKIVARIVIQLVKRFWAFSSAAVLSFVLFYWLFGGILAFSFMTFALSGLLYHAGDKLLYHPEQPDNARVFVPSPSMVGMNFESLYIHSKDQTRLHMFLVKTTSTSPTILFFHGNAGNIGHRILCIKDFVKTMNCNVCLLEYRGYGHSDGSPCEEGLYLDAQAALDHLQTRQDVDPTKIIVFGRSLGGAVAIDLCSKAENRDKIAGLMVENSFTSIPDIACVLFDFKIVRMLPKFLYKNKFNSRWKTKRIAIPALFLSGSSDSLVPPKMMTQLFNACGSDTKYLAKFSAGTHNDTWQSTHYLQTIAFFFEEVVQFNGPAQGRLRPPPTLVASSQHTV